MCAIIFSHRLQLTHSRMFIGFTYIRSVWYMRVYSWNLILRLSYAWRLRPSLHYVNNLMILPLLILPIWSLAPHVTVLLISKYLARRGSQKNESDSRSPQGVEMQ